MKVTHTGKWIYGICQGVTFLLIVVAAAIGGGAGWLMLEPREIPEITQRLEQNFNHTGSPYVLKIEKTILALGDFLHPLNVIIKDVKLLGREGEVTAEVPAMHVALDLWGLLSGHITPDRIALVEPKLSLYQDEKGFVFLSSADKRKAIALRSLFAASADEKEEGNALFGNTIEEVTINAANLQFRSGLTQLKMNIPSADITLRQYAGILRGRLDMKAIQKDRENLALGTYFTYDPSTQGLSLHVSFNDLTPSDYAELMPELSVVSEIKTPLSGNIEVQMTLPQQVQKVGVNLSAGQGTVQFEPYVPQKLALRQLRLKGKYDHEHGIASLENFLLKLKTAEISASGEATHDAEGRPAIKAKADIRNLSSKQLIKLWPEFVGREPREWVAESILSAQVPEAKFTINAPAGSLDQSPLPDDVLKAKIEVRDAEVRYMSGFPEVHRGEGTVTITGNTLTVDIDKADMLEATSLVAPGKVFIPDLSQENTTIQLDLPVSSTASDVVEFIKSTSYKLPPKLNFAQETITGDLQGDVKLEILDKISPIPDDITFTIDTQISNFSQPKFYKGMDLESANGKLIATDKKLTVDATGALQGQPLIFAAELTGKQEDYQVKAKLPHDLLRNFGIDTEPYVTGDLAVNLDWVETGGGNSRMNAQVDLTPSLLRIENIEYQKDAGVSATLNLKGSGSRDGVNFDAFRLIIPESKDEVIGSAKVSYAENAVTEVNFSKLHVAGTEASGTYRRIPGGYYVHAAGSRLDISYRDHDEEIKNAAPEGEKTPDTKPERDWKIPALDLQLVFDEVIISKDQKKKLHDLKLTMQCDPVICQHLDMQALAGKSAPFSMNISRQNNRRVLTAYTPRADILLREMNIFDDMRKGDMRIVGIYEDDKPSHPLVGKLTIGEHRVKDVPMLTKLLTVATFTGIVDALGGSGLVFNKLVAPFTMENFVVHLKDAKTAGPSIGITADGSINLNKGEMNLRGTVIPAYMFNALIRSIPLLGNVFGALAGDGLVAVRYSMMGDKENPDVAVNPLSALTPGFLRGFFSIFEEIDPNAKGAPDTTDALKAMEKEINAIRMPVTTQPLQTSPNTAAAIAVPVIPVQQKPASVLSPAVKPTEVRK